MKAKNKITVGAFIKDIWNGNRFDQIEKYLADDFTDHSLPPPLPANKDGLIQWITATGKSFNHQTLIEHMVAEDDKVMIKIAIQLEHIGPWRDIEPTGLKISAVGYRFFLLSNNKITDHWALVDGNAIENELKQRISGCKVQE